MVVEVEEVEVDEVVGDVVVVDDVVLDDVVGDVVLVDDVDEVDEKGVAELPYSTCTASTHRVPVAEPCRPSP